MCRQQKITGHALRHSAKVQDGRSLDVGGIKMKRHVARKIRHRSKPGGRNGTAKAHSFRAYFTRIAHAAARITGHPATFITAVSLVVVWAVLGPFFHYSDTWQLVINTSTTIVTFLMVFLVQNTQNRDSLAMQLKLTELVIAVRGARNGIATIEELSDEELEKLHDQYCAHSKLIDEALSRRRS